MDSPADSPAQSRPKWVLVGGAPRGSCGRGFENPRWAGRRKVEPRGRGCLRERLLLGAQNSGVAEAGGPASV